ncbi:competence/damage-inducible protein A [Desulfovibrio sp. OttesenSCG-928-O18]|nr:competence/damage-inducible protein A [Desulfovibrio sp. OttesenSCG-928-O18]
MNAEILCVGTELLLGDTVNTNAAFIARELAACGIGCYYQTVVGDNPERLKSTLEHAFSRADMVITTGGLGPTYDDLTKETVAAYFGREMVLHEESLEQLKAFFNRVGRPMAENNIKQAYMPRGATVFPNDRGTAPGLALEGNGKIVIMLPGPPREMHAMFENSALPYLRSLSNTTLVSHNIHLFGIGESALENELREYMQAHSNPTIAPYAKEGEVLLRVTASAPDKAAADALIRPVLDELCARYEQFVYGVDVGNLGNALVFALRENGRTIAVVENATGGYVSKRICDVPGSSDVFLGGICAPLDAARARLLGLAPAGAERIVASEECAMAMAVKIREITGADIGLAVAGIAEAADATEVYPQGQVCIAVSSDKLERTVTRQLAGKYADAREIIRYRGSSHALHQALKAAKA